MIRVTGAAFSPRATTKSPAWATGSSGTRPPWIETVKSLRPDFPVYGSMIEVSECLTRLIGQENAMMWMAEYPERMGAVINRTGRLLSRNGQGRDRGGRWLARWVRDLGRRGLQEMHLHVAPLLAGVFQTVGGADGRGRPRSRLAGHLPRLRQREGDLRRLTSRWASTPTIRSK